jgi:hypothetical protein
MTQTTDRPITIPSRRAFLTRAAPAAAAFALAGGAAVNAVASGLAATPEIAATPVPDPIFAMIDRHRPAFNEHARAGRVFAKYADEDPPAIVVGERPKYKGVNLLDPDAEPVGCRGRSSIFADFSNKDEIHVRRVPTGEMEPIIARSREQIADSAPVDMTDPERAAWIKMMERRLRAAERRYKNSSRSLAYDVWNDTHDVLERLTKEMVSTPPTTIGGVAAVLAYWSEIATEDESFLDLFSTARFLEKMAEATSAIA